MNNEHVLRECRAQIDAVDEKIVQLLAQRFAIVHQVALLKREHGIAARLPQRMQQVHDRIAHLAAQYGVPVDCAAALWQEIMNASCQYEVQLEVPPV